ncbi:MAG: glycerol dehydratase reactivase beta/small subunit family protein [Pseudonocardia sp.]|nr:glycerol dehydratase reactivase beta/small subunit family protein [Pseudonocardia sp.]
MSAEDEATRPVITILISGGENLAGVLREVAAGIEEEGVPYDLRSGSGADPVALAHTAAHASPLDVGVGVSARGISVHHAKLPADRPVAHAREATHAVGRRMGHDAARIVTGLPLKLAE